MACLDSWVVLAWLDGEQTAGSQLERVLNAGRPLMSWINLVEVQYCVARDHGGRQGHETVENIRSIVTEELPGIARMREVAALKAEHPIALADCFAIATAAAAGTDLLTGDPEIIERSAQLPCGIIDCRTT